MNKRLILLPALFMASSVLILTSCNKDDDTTAPVITLNGDPSMEIELQEGYVEPGATAVDGEDGTLNVSITGVVNDDLTGDYTVFYSATDESGNTGSAERTVTVVNSADFLGGSYINATDSCVTSGTATFNATVNPSDTENGEFTVTNFGAFGQSIIITLDYESSTGKITGDIPQGLGGGSNLTNIFASSGVISSSSPVIFRINYQWTDNTGLGEICTSTYTK